MAVLTRLLLALVVIAVDNAAASNITAVTFNLALSDFGTGIVGIPEREAATIQQLIQLDADVICLQEVPRGPNVENIVNALAAEGYSSSLSYLHDNTTWTFPDQSAVDHAPCPLSLVDLMGQIGQTCPIPAGEPFSSVLECIADHFWTDILALGRECRVCLGTGGSAAEAGQLCIFSNFTINLPGLIMLSKAPMTNQEVVDLHQVETVFPRYYLKADVAGIGTTVCTHLSSPSTPYVEPELEQYFTSYEWQNYYEVGNLLYQMKDDSDVLFLGDLNTGPKIPAQNIDAQFPHSYTRLTKGRSPFKTITPPLWCSFCADNAWNVVTINTENIVIDHVFTRGLNLTCLERVLDNPVAVYIVALSGYYPLSDHYGVKACIKV